MLTSGALPATRPEEGRAKAIAGPLSDTTLKSV